MSAKVGTLPPGSHGWDCNAKVSKEVASLFFDAGYRFVVRYVRRATRHDYDISAIEFLNLLQAGIAVSLVQHVAAPGWRPTASLGGSYGAIAAEEARAIGYMRGAILWLDLEGVADSASSADVIGFCNAWHDAVSLAGFDTGLYVGYGCILTADQLYNKLKFRRYWSAYNLNSDSVPAVRGVCMRQGAFPPPDERIAGVPFEYDVDEITGDHFNNLPTMVLPGDPG